MMSSELEKAKSLLDGSNYTCVLCGNKTVYTAEKRGVLPLLDFLDGDTDFTGFSAADRVVGNGAAYLYILLDVKEVYAGLISKPALETLEKGGIAVSYGEIVQNIINRTKTGICPIEEAVGTCTNADEALTAIKKKLNYGVKNNDI